MKAEHRKELETNVLADRMGRAIQSMKHRPRSAPCCGFFSSAGS